jgi:hypothetical protein
MGREVMKPGHPRWAEFRDRLEGPEGCDFTQKDPEDINTVTWNCAGGEDQSLARAVLEKTGDIDIEASLAYFSDHGGHCDCEILFNVRAE